MDKTRLYLREQGRYPGLVRPYADGDGRIDKTVLDSTFSTIRSHERIAPRANRMNELRGKPKSCDPFSIYDDDRGEDHYFLVPRIQGDSIQIHEWRRTVKNSRSLRNISNFMSDSHRTNLKRRTCTYPPSALRPANLGQNKQNTDSGEYCSLSAKSKTQQNFNSSHSLQQNLLRPTSHSFHAKNPESLQVFASKFTTSNDTCESQSKSRSRIHSFDERKFDTWVELDGITGSDSRTKIRTRTKVDDAIDYGTCMTCVKGIFYHCTKDDVDGGVVDPCTCTGSKSGILKRWLCLGFLGCLMPCLFCYLPAKGCLRLSRKLTDGRSNNDSIRVKYKKRDRHKLKENSTLL